MRLSTFCGLHRDTEQEHPYCLSSHLLFCLPPLFLSVISSPCLPAAFFTACSLIFCSPFHYLYYLFSLSQLHLPPSLLPVHSSPVLPAAFLLHAFSLILMLPAATASSCSLISWSSYRYPFLSLLFCLPPSLLPPTYLFSLSSPFFACLTLVLPVL